MQSVAARLGAYYGVVPAVPLGQFYAGGNKPGPTLMMAPPDGFNPKQFANIGFAEVHWAGIAREVAKDGYVLEESKKWARTITARLARFPS